MKRILAVWAEAGGRRGRIDVVVIMMGGGVVFNHKGSVGIGCVEWVGHEVEEMQISNWLS